MTPVSWRILRLAATIGGPAYRSVPVVLAGPRGGVLAGARAGGQGRSGAGGLQNRGADGLASGGYAGPSKSS